MSRPSTTQIIEKGEYLDPGFDPNTLTIPTLIGIFAYHQIPYQASGNKKAKLVELFNENIKARGNELKLERQATEETLASNDGILNGVTGSPASPPAQPRRSGRLSRQSSVEPDALSVQTQPRRRRTSTERSTKRGASAEPSGGRKAPKKSGIKEEPIIIEESEESDPEPQPRSKAGKKKAAEAAGSSSRRVSDKFGPGTEDSGWEDNNIFQSGGESSPVKESAPKPRKSTLRKSRKSSEPPLESTSPFTSPAFAPSLPAMVQTPVKSDFRFKFDDPYEADMSGIGDTSIADVSRAIIVDEDEDDDSEAQPQRILPREGSPVEVREGSQESESTTGTGSSESTSASENAKKSQVVRAVNSSPGVPWWQRIITTLLVLALSGLSAHYKLESAPIGFCARGTQTNTALKAFRDTRRQIESCHIQPADGKLTACPPLEIVPLPHPDSCTPCPEHATCDLFSIQCDEGYIQSPHPLSRIPYSELANGLPGFGPIAFPPRCIDDVLRKRNIGNLGKLIDAELATVKGDRICAGIDPEKPVDGGEGRKWGLSSHEIVELLRKKKVSESFGSESDFEQALFKVLGELEKYGRITKTYSASGHDFYSSNHSTLTLSCKALVSARQRWQDYRASIFGVVLMYFTWLYGKSSLARRREEAQRVAELVQYALSALQSQEMAHHVDPVSHPHPYLSSDQLRDVVLAEEHNPRQRRKLWHPIERVIEGNANVQVNLEELPSGAEGRVWRWVGTSGLTSPRKQRSSYPSPSHEQLGMSPYGRDNVYA